MIEILQMAQCGRALRGHRDPAWIIKSLMQRIRNYLLVRPTIIDDISHVVCTHTHFLSLTSFNISFGMILHSITSHMLQIHILSLSCTNKRVKKPRLLELPTGNVHLVLLSRISRPMPPGYTGCVILSMTSAIGGWMTIFVVVSYFRISLLQMVQSVNEIQSLVRMA